MCLREVRLRQQITESRLALQALEQHHRDHTANAAAIEADDPRHRSWPTLASRNTGTLRNRDRPARGGRACVDTAVPVRPVLAPERSSSRVRKRRAVFPGRPKPSGSGHQSVGPGHPVKFGVPSVGAAAADPPSPVSTPSNTAGKNTSWAATGSSAPTIVPREVGDAAEPVGPTAPVGPVGPMAPVGRSPRCRRSAGRPSGAGRVPSPRCRRSHPAGPGGTGVPGRPDRSGGAHRSGRPGGSSPDRRGADRPVRNERLPATPVPPVGPGPPGEAGRADRPRLTGVAGVARRPNGPGRAGRPGVAGRPHRPGHTERPRRAGRPVRPGRAYRTGGTWSCARHEDGLGGGAVAPMSPRRRSAQLGRRAR